MSDLYLHSMAEFGDLILDGLRLAGVRDIVEIGAEFGGMSARLAAFARARDGRLTSIDPEPKPAFASWLGEHPEVTHIAQPSLEALAQVAAADAWIVDGDHNWYTVHHELKAIEAACRRDGKPLLAFLHDVGWPCARRDLYYAPDRVPADFRQPFCFDGGVVLGDSGLHAGRGLRGAGQFAWALGEGGPRNGVLTAIEDFVADAPEGAYCFARIPAVLGLGVLFDAAAPWSPDLATLLVPYHDNRLLETIEINRLRNYLAVLDWQDRAAA
ncbi:class I SAM-dependent methyltransferase [Hephaestia sp. GCM10023244]|uniref:class I SAM-dependent methyltransferase n=1 Tax=unclassified Hephaestia TaxID=2631281 RepID=UPI0020778051|nr:class I SAM-dependent methyltransferase [Hephaestia sp. MAHUQ-44]MCM8729537.1 class I SAM-dependent methyltransferase [Hephaestia sp. MAHUQ-44]